MRITNSSFFSKSILNNISQHFSCQLVAAFIFDNASCVSFLFPYLVNLVSFVSAENHKKKIIGWYARFLSFSVTDDLKQKFVHLINALLIFKLICDTYKVSNLFAFHLFHIHSTQTHTHTHTIFASSFLAAKKTRISYIITITHRAHRKKSFYHQKHEILLYQPLIDLR
jgi:hypothetical protein